MSSSSLSSEASQGEITIIRCSQGSVSKSANHTWPHVAQVKRISGNGQEHTQNSDHYLPSLHHLSKSDFSQHLIWLSSFHSLSGILGSPLLSLSSSRTISIFDKNSTESQFATVRKKATAIAKRCGECSEMLVFLRKRGRKTVRIIENYRGSNFATESTAVRFLVRKGPLGGGLN